MAEVIVTSVGYLKQEITAGRHKLIADEPISEGGGDEGPGPYELLLAALGACTAMTLQVYAKRKEWKLKKVEVSLTHGRIHAKDCEDCTTTDGKVTQIERYISLTGDISDEQKSRLLEVARQCPVHKTLTGEISIKDHID